MRPQGAPTTWFSADWAIWARRRFDRPAATAAAAATSGAVVEGAAAASEEARDLKERKMAHSTLALLLTPCEVGTVELISRIK